MMNRLVPNPGRYSRIRRRPLGPSAGGSAAPASGAAFVATANAGGSSRPAAFPLGSGGTTIRPAVAGHQQRRGGGRRPSAPFFSSLAIDFFEGDEPPHEGDGVAGLPLGLGSTLLRAEDLLAAPSAESEGVEAAARTGEASGEGDVSRGSGNGGGDPEPERPAPRNDGGDGDPLFDGLRSRPKPGGAWDPRDPLDWCAPFGSRSPADAERLSTLTRLGPGDDGYHDVSTVTCPDVTIVRTPAQAETVLAALTKAAEENPGAIHACDTEVMDIDLKLVGPVGHGYVTCLSVYSGPDFDYGLGDGPGTALWVDNLDDSHGLLQAFRPWLEDERALKVWHNYGFDRHVLFNEGINVKGFGGDTMHMARLADTSRMKYSLESLSDELLGARKVPMKEIFGERRLRKDGSEGALVDLPPMERLQREPKYRKKWIEYSAYDARSTYNLYMHLVGTLKQWPWTEYVPHPVDEEDGPTFSRLLVGNPDKPVEWRTLMEYYHRHMRPFGELLTDMERRGILIATDYLAGVEVQARKDRVEHVETFRQWAAEQIGPDGLAMNLGSSTQLSTFLFGGAANPKTKEHSEVQRVFRTKREEIPDDAMEAYRERDAKLRETAPNAAETDEERDYGFLTKLKATDLKALCKEEGLKVSGKKQELIDRLVGAYQLKDQHKQDPNIPVSNLEEYKSMKKDDLRDAVVGRGLSPPAKAKKTDLVRLLEDDDEMQRQLMAECAKSPDADRPGGDAMVYRKMSELLEEAASSGENPMLAQILADVKAKNEEEPKWVDVTITSLGMVPDKFTVGGAPSATADVLRGLAGDPFADPPKYGKAYEFFEAKKAGSGHDACVAFYSLTAIGSIDTMIANFLTSLQALVDDRNRVHNSININTETGRLSSRKPNLQNQPALEKDKYKIRQAFIASPGNRLIVADYGQLELRLLASMTNCVSMIEAFKAGGDFHSRTALDMFKYIQDAVESGEVILEWDYANGEPTKPMVKDKYASERRNAKTLNFSIAYGKTAHGLSQDWGVSKKEAEGLLQAWYDSRPEVEKWQKTAKDTAKKEGTTRTLMGRYRHLPHARGGSMKQLGHALRASINTPIQGGAADVAMMAMIKINNSEKLKRLGWILLMQVHDEVMLEGPEETAEEAFEEVLECMQEPWVLGLDKTKVPLLVDGSCEHDNWYDAK